MVDEDKVSQEIPQVYDMVYKLMYSLPRVVTDTLEYVLEPDEFAKLDLNTLREIPNELVTGGLKLRVADSVWQIRYRGDGAYMLVLIEFQSTIDSKMALRIADYVTMLRQRWMSSKKHATQPPLILPVVIYSGDDQWNAATELVALLPPSGDSVLAYQQQQKYFLTSMQQNNVSNPGKSVLKHMICMASARNAADSIQSVKGMLQLANAEGWLDAHIKIFVQWAHRAAVPKDNKNIRWWELTLDKLLMEVMNMSGNVRLEKIAEHEQGIFDKGREEGREEERRNVNKRTIPRLIEAGVPLEDIRAGFDLTPEEFEEFRSGGSPTSSN